MKAGISLSQAQSYHYQWISKLKPPVILVYDNPGLALNILDYCKEWELDTKIVYEIPIRNDNAVTAVRLFFKGIVNSQLKDQVIFKSPIQWEQHLAVDAEFKMCQAANDLGVKLCLSPSDQNQRHWTARYPSLKLAANSGFYIGYEEHYALYPFIGYPESLNTDVIWGNQSEITGLSPYPKTIAPGKYIGAYRTNQKDLRDNWKLSIPAIIFFGVRDTTLWDRHLKHYNPDYAGWKSKEQQWKTLRGNTRSISQEMRYAQDLHWCNDTAYCDDDVLGFIQDTHLGYDFDINEALLDIMMPEYVEEPAPKPIIKENWLIRWTRKMRNKRFFEAAYETERIIAKWNQE